jgi:hypothetical protein
MSGAVAIRSIGATASSSSMCLGKYIISDRPMSEEEWAHERADVLDAEPASGDGPEENYRSYAEKLLVGKP